MTLEPVAPRDLAKLFRPLHEELLTLLRGLSAEQWHRPTVAGAWRVRDVAAHLLDTQLRKLSGHRDAHDFGDSPRSYDDVVALINRLNASGVEFGKRLSTRVLVELLEFSGVAVATFVESLDPHLPARFPVAWAGESESQNWMDTGREYTEWWHHQMQIRDAVDAPRILLEDRWLEPLLDFSVRALPHAYRDIRDAKLALHVGAHSWTLQGGHMYRGAAEDAATRVFLDPDVAWRLFYNAPVSRTAIRIEGDAALAEPLLGTRSVMV